MQSEPCWPRIIMGTPLRKQSSERSVPTLREAQRAVKRAPQWCGAPAVDRRVAGDSFMRTGRTCMSTRSLFLHAIGFAWSAPTSSAPSRRPRAGQWPSSMSGRPAQGRQPGGFLLSPSHKGCLTKRNPPENEKRRKPYEEYLRKTGDDQDSCADEQTSVRFIPSDGLGKSKSNKPSILWRSLSYTLLSKSLSPYFMATANLPLDHRILWDVACLRLDDSW